MSPVFGQPPWHMWGSEQTISVVPGFAAALPVTQSNQLIRINYKRPESWKFFAYAELVGPVATGVGTDVIVVCDIDLNFGVGRTQWASQGGAVPGSGPVSAQSFIRFQWRRLPSTNIPLRSKKWTASASTPQLQDDAMTPDVRLVDTIVAEDIQAKATCFASQTGPALGAPVSIAVGIFFAPVNHIRPDWFRNLSSGTDADEESIRFRGDEAGGT